MFAVLWHICEEPRDVFQSSIIGFLKLIMHNFSLSKNNTSINFKGINQEKIVEK